MPEILCDQLPAAGNTVFNFLVGSKKSHDDFHITFNIFNLFSIFLMKPSPFQCSRKLFEQLFLLLYLISNQMSEDIPLNGLP